MGEDILVFALPQGDSFDAKALSAILDMLASKGEKSGRYSVELETTPTASDPVAEVRLARGDVSLSLVVSPDSGQYFLLHEKMAYMMVEVSDGEFEALNGAEKSKMYNLLESFLADLFDLIKARHAFGAHGHIFDQWYERHYRTRHSSPTGYLFPLNYFGNEIVNRISEGKILSAPGQQAEKTSSGYLLVVDRDLFIGSLLEGDDDDLTDSMISAGTEDGSATQSSIDDVAKHLGLSL
jgi:hypothetical protein